MDVVERAKAIVLTPDAEWPVIAREPGDMQYLFTNYVAILALIPAVGGFLGRRRLIGDRSGAARRFRPGCLLRCSVTCSPSSSSMSWRSLIDSLAQTFGAHPEDSARR